MGGHIIYYIGRMGPRGKTARHCGGLMGEPHAAPFGDWHGETRVPSLWDTAPTPCRTRLSWLWDTALAAVGAVSHGDGSRVSWQREADVAGLEEGPTKSKK